jgi:hypothetical protein
MSPGRHWSAGLSVVMLAVACMFPGSPSEYRGQSTIAPADAYSCALAFVDRAGYTVSSSDRAGGFLRATQGAGTNSRDVLAVTILPLAGGKTEFHVTAETFGISLTKEGSQSYMAQPSGSVKAIATLLLSRCGTPGAPPPADSGRAS